MIFSILICIHYNPTGQVDLLDNSDEERDRIRRQLMLHSLEKLFQVKPLLRGLGLDDSCHSGTAFGARYLA